MFLIMDIFINSLNSNFKSASNGINDLNNFRYELYRGNELIEWYRPSGYQNAVNRCRRIQLFTDLKCEIRVKNL